MTEDGVVVKAELGVEADEVVFAGDDEGVDFEHGAVAGDEGFVEPLEDRDGFADQFAAEAEAEGDLAALEGGEADQGVDGFGEDLFGGFGGDFFDVHAPFGGGHDGDFGAAAVDDEADVEFTGDVAAVLHEDAGDEFPFGAGLVGAQGHAEHFPGDEADFVGGAGQFDAAPFAAAAGVDLGLDYPGPFAEPFGPLPGAGAVVADVPVGNRDAEFSQNRFCLVFVDVHGVSWALVFCFNLQPAPHSASHAQCQQLGQMHQPDPRQLVSQPLLQLEQTTGIAGHQNVSAAGSNGVKLALQYPVGHLRLGNIVRPGAAATGVGRFQLLVLKLRNQFKQFTRLLADPLAMGDMTGIMVGHLQRQRFEQ